MMFSGRALSLVCFAILSSFLASAAAPEESFYRTHDLTLLVGTSSGGGYDVAARFLAPFLAKRIPGNPRIVIDNMPGAGGIVAANYLEKSAPRDGSLLALLLNNVAFEPLFGTKSAVYNPRSFNWIGSTSPETAFLIVWGNVPVKTLRDAQTRQITVGTSGAASAPTFFARLLNVTLHTKLKIILGYPGTAEAFHAMEQQELDGYASAFTSDLTSFKPQWVRDHKIRIIFQYGAEPDPDYKNVPFAPDSITDQNDRVLMKAGSALLAMGRPFAMPPNVPRDRVEMIRRAFEQTVRDPHVIEAAKKMGINLSRGQSGQQIEQIVDQEYGLPEALIARLKQLKAQQ